MEIGPLSNERPVSQPNDPNRKQKEAQSFSRETGDKVEISQDARARLAELADSKLRAEKAASELAPQGVEDSPEEVWIEKIRQRIESGLYDRPEVKEKIAERFIDDLDNIEKD